METTTYDRIWSPSRVQEDWRTRLERALLARAYRVLDDAALVRRARAKDRAAFDALVARYRNRLYTLALDSLGNEDAASAALCDMVVSAFQDIDSFGTVCAPGTWLYLHGIRAVFKRLNVPPGKYAVEVRSAAR